jgi:molybdopterin/thiamine biosynthesis adenylyltransferase
MAAAPEGAPCYRCLFEDLPSGDAPDCATAGVMGPVCGVSGAVAADLALRVLSRGALSSPYGFIVTYDGRTDRLRKVPVRPRPDCELCGASPTIEVLDEDRYAPPSCALGLD